MAAFFLVDAREWREALAVYLTRRQLVIFLMGFSSGLPLLLGFSTLSFWLREADVGLAAIGGLLTVATPYSLKFLWAPLLDHVRLPIVTRWLGLRRGWLLTIQLLLIGSIVVVGQGNPSHSLGFLAAAALVMAFLSASQDIVVDAYRIEILAEHEQGAGAAMTQVGYRVGMLASGAGALAFYFVGVAQDCRGVALVESQVFQVPGQNLAIADADGEVSNVKAVEYGGYYGRDFGVSHKA